MNIKLKKLLSIILTLIFCVSATACATSKTDETPVSDDTIISENTNESSINTNEENPNTILGNTGKAEEKDKTEKFDSNEETLTDEITSSGNSDVKPSTNTSFVSTNTSNTNPSVDLGSEKVETPVSTSKPIATPEVTTEPTTKPTVTPKPTPTPTATPRPVVPSEGVPIVHYHGDGTDNGICPVCGLSYSPVIDISKPSGADDLTHIFEYHFNSAYSSCPDCGFTWCPKCGSSDHTTHPEPTPEPTPESTPVLNPTPDSNTELTASSDVNIEETP